MRRTKIGSQHLSSRGFFLDGTHAVIILIDVLGNHGFVPREGLLQVGKRIARHAKGRRLDVMGELVESARICEEEGDRTAFRTIPRTGQNRGGSWRAARVATSP